MKFAICNELFQGWSLEQTVNHVAKIGYDALEIAPFTLARSVTDIEAAERRRIRSMVNAAGIQVSGIHWVLVQTEGLHLTHPEPGVRDRTSRYLVDLVDFCADIGGRFIVVGSPKQRNLDESTTREIGVERAIEVFRVPVRHATERDVTICLEPLAPTETNFINTAEEAIGLTRTINSPHFKIILDVKAMCSESKPVPQIIRESWPHFAYFHANDRNLKGPGFGDVDFLPIASALREVGYTGYVSVEVFNYDEGPETIASRSLEYLHRSFRPPGP